ncbi:dimethylarginine dimethylaminohydrolase family protein [Acidomonas methanolica]|nr:arginine deiminase-related protein [Acidomonas methanolica]MBU2653395.1 amidinotransferase [Acidomonas methanolica]
MTPHFLLVDPSHYVVSYAINPWMEPGVWSADAAGNRERAWAGFEALASGLARAGAKVTIEPGRPGVPDMVFTANAGIVFDGRVLPARFLFDERKDEEPFFRAIFERLVGEGVLREIVDLPEGMHQEGAGDCLWDRTRRLAWVGFGQRSDEASVRVIAETFGIDVEPLRLATPRFYHLDTCFHVLPRGEVLFYPPAFAPETVARIEAIVPPDKRIVATERDARHFSVNAIAFEDQVVMAHPPQELAARLSERGYHVTGVPLEPFILSGGGAYCMTLRLDNTTR